MLGLYNLSMWHFLNNTNSSKEKLYIEFNVSTNFKIKIIKNRTNIELIWQLVLLINLKILHEKYTLIGENGE